MSEKPATTARKWTGREIHQTVLKKCPILSIIDVRETLLKADSDKFLIIRAFL